MAIAYDTSTQGHQASGTSLTYSHTCTGTGTTGILFVGILQQRTSAPSGQDDVTGVTYNGVAMTRIDTRLSISNTWRIYLYYLLVPATGANNVVISVGANSDIYGQSSSYTGVYQTGTIDVFTNTTGAGTSLATTVTTTFSSTWGFMIASYDNGTALTGTDCTKLQTGGTLVSIFDTAGARSPAGSQSMTVTYATQNVHTIAAFFKAVPIEISNSETVTLTEITQSTIKTLVIATTDTITMTRVFISSVSDTLGISEVINKFSGIWSNVTKNISTWTNQDKS